MTWYDPVGLIAGTHHFLQHQDAADSLGGYAVMLVVIALHLLVVVFVALMAGAFLAGFAKAPRRFAEGFRAGYQRARH